MSIRAHRDSIAPSTVDTAKRLRQGDAARGGDGRRRSTQITPKRRLLRASERRSSNHRRRTTSERGVRRRGGGDDNEPPSNKHPSTPLPDAHPSSRHVAMGAGDAPAARTTTATARDRERKAPRDETRPTSIGPHSPRRMLRADPSPPPRAPTCATTRAPPTHHDTHLSCAKQTKPNQTKQNKTKQNKTKQNKNKNKNKNSS